MNDQIRGNQFYVWFDTEYSTLELETAYLLQVAAVITDSSLKRVLPSQQDVRLSIRVPDEQTLSPWVEEHLPDLVKTCRSSEAVDKETADERLAGYLEAVTRFPAEQEDQRPVLAGNSIHSDWYLIRRFLPRFHGRLHYRHLDVTAFKLEWKQLHPDWEFKKEDPGTIIEYFPEAVLPANGARHDAYYDVQASIAELAFYRRFLFQQFSGGKKGS